MAGILDKKTRFIDLIVTQEGKRQIASGKLRAEYISVTDMHAFYNKGYNFSEVGDRLYFQAMERPEHAITMEKDDSGKLFMFDHSPTGSIVGNSIFEKEGNVATDLHKLKIATGSQFASLSAGLEKSFLKHFKSNFFIATKDLIGDVRFEISDNDLNYQITNNVPFQGGPNKEIINVNQAEPFMLDSKLTHLPNFQFLPPVNEDGSPYGEYKDIRNTTKENWPDIIDHLGYKAFADVDINETNNLDTKKDTAGDAEILKNKLKVNRQNFIPLSRNIKQNFNKKNKIKKEYKTIKFKKTSADNNLMIQMFEKNNNLLKKLDIIDAGTFLDTNDPNKKFDKHVFYAGKIFLDDFNTPTFVNIFTIIFD